MPYSKPWNRVLLKISGEALGSSAGDESIDEDQVDRVAQEICAAKEASNVEVGIVVGGGNIWRGAKGTAAGMDRTTSDHMGMLATVINALALKDALVRCGQSAEVQTALPMSRIAGEYIRGKAIKWLQDGKVVIFAAGTGNPFFTTDTAAALRAAEIEADVLLKATHGEVDGVYDADPRFFPEAKLFSEVSFKELIARDLRPMDMTAITTCADNQTPMLVFNMMKPGNIREVLTGNHGRIGTLVTV